MEPNNKGEISPFSFFCLSGALQPIVASFSIQAEIETKITEALQKPETKCKCKKAHCLKLYCECFSKQAYCSGCECRNCFNVPETDEIRTTAIQKLLEKNPRAFGVDESYRYCKCKRSGCKKNYCECFQRGKHCQVLCKCKGCKNKPKFK